ncbi:MCE family protein [Mycolicibacterium pulveris]|uniref:Mce family protein n=1 Tax=Mycolicibacterium pulveris TaxID=36813 RepID=A0A7I7UQW4_MYCPV|nr:MlaD family protein [Mycolicibacterium pulveris]MCV6983541.1 MCE family protein [Mycolicibacterium pulveris]BBY83420.1 hypothetical protein MPUL_45780 [Mycolicibacterium pulveris]
MTNKAALWRLLLSAVATTVLLVLLISGISKPIAPETKTYSAYFTDVSGLREGADVRIRGVLVGRVESAALERLDDQSVAAVKFSLDKHYGIVSDTRLAIKYQTLTGSRYLDVINPAEGDIAEELVTTVPTSMTQPSFDVTQLFNGLQPVIATLSPEELNEFADNAANFLAGDSDGLASMLDSIRKLTRFMSDRQEVIATLMNNLADVADTMGGQSADLIKLINMVNRSTGPVDKALSVLDEFRKSEIFGPGFILPVQRLVTAAGFPTPPDGFTPVRDIDMALDTAFNNVDLTIDAFKLIPVMWENIPPPVPDGTPEPCSKGRFDLPLPMDVLLNGQRVVLCNR